MITVHLIFNAHIDPIWLWPWQSGLDTLLATCRSACDRLDAHPDVHFCRGEAWAYREIERMDPQLFARIRKHIDEGRWHIVGGWWLQPDCNGPAGVGFEQQISLGKEYFQEKFRLFPRCAFNVDSFGHAATLPGMMRAAGQDRYVFMRPQEHEMDLPGRVFRWRGYENGPEVTAFRIAKAYTTRNITAEHILAACEGLPAGVQHTMCFVGFGDHGGGPTEGQIAWCREHMDKIPGVKLVFSHVDAFFDAIADQIPNLPVVTGELQHHSIGCYSVHRPVKVGVHNGEDRLVQAAVVHRQDPHPEPQTEERLKEAWRWICFGHFHDTFGGTCIPSAYEQVHAQLGYAYAVADETIQHGMRRIMGKLPDDSLQRIVLLNASNAAYEGPAYHEPWLEASHWQPHWRLLDEQGKVVPHQRMLSEALVPDDYLFFLRLVFPIKLGPGELRVLRIDTETGKNKPYPEIASRVKTSPSRIENDVQVAVALEPSRIEFAERSLPLPMLEMVEDLTDTWTHEVDRYSQKVLARPVVTRAEVLDSGPLMASLQVKGKIGESELVTEYRVFAGEPFIEYHVRVYWNERHKLLKLTLPLPGEMGERIDGIPGGELVRQPDGKERPVTDFTLIPLADGTNYGIVLPHAYALDASGDKVRITLLRSPKMAHHWPFAGQGPRAVYADQGRHEFVFRFFCGPQVTTQLLAKHASMLHHPLVSADLTRGMPPQELAPYIATNMAT
ncbi:MAG TPA: glycoside hydrolase family 38 C-terminal domain-containing protein [Phycisphaerae bacterium]|nr:glycoside hydrolase family 38 C-terminal domain-containing protein [Phycisphaerae bacterium]HOM51343.1 glycoside hydrolase family 38 C-terminal domain-containing protein [Phycisphaerae bacterium]HON66254.1 glycoside hydrolase family 38 C-terminal domain-containing protein [Phycisphaerae bacterium]HOQ87007.1 glycoside hydrolase family 38 C-terminal domain-containing protein [Phycisphaerae bacterium]HPP26694.1 glycoside hydrolase family 38 C-terminal domain-containing protein [Phycisphaerae ba